MENTKNFLSKKGFPAGDSCDLAATSKRFPDGAHYRIEIPSCEGPEALKAVLKAAKYWEVPIQRVSQGSGILMHTDKEIREMVQIGNENGIEVSLFVGPRASRDIGSQAFAPGGKSIGWRHRGMDQVVYALEDIKRGCELGLRSILVADIGLLWAVNEMKKAGELPVNLVVKVSVQIGASNPISAKIMEDFGAGTLNVPTDLTVPMIAAIREAISIPIDLYIEIPESLGGIFRYYDIPGLIRSASPIYIKMGLANAPDVYPGGKHLESTVVSLSEERVHHARIAWELIQRLCPDAVTSEPGVPDLGIPEIC